MPSSCPTDVMASSTNLHKELICPSWPPGTAAGAKLFFQGQYIETSTGDGDLNITCVGLRVVLAVQPIFKALTTVMNAFESQADQAATSAERVFEAPKGKKGAHVAEEGQILREKAADAYSWWGESVMKGALEVGICEVILLQDCCDASSARVVLSLACKGVYEASRSSETGWVELQDLTLYSVLPDISDPLPILGRTPVVCKMKREYGKMMCVALRGVCMCWRETGVDSWI